MIIRPCRFLHADRKPLLSGIGVCKDCIEGVEPRTVSHCMSDDYIMELHQTHCIPLLAPTQAPADDWMQLLHLNAAEPPQNKRKVSREDGETTTSRSFTHFRPPAPSESEEEEEQQPPDIFHEEFPPQVPTVFHRECAGLPIFFHDGAACVSDTLRTTVNRYTESGPFYIGATLDPRMRWLGRDGPAGERGNMPGHHGRWSAMVVIAFTEEGPRIETSAIELAMVLWPDRCTNKTADARGQVRGMKNFIYVCV